MSKFISLFLVSLLSLSLLAPLAEAKRFGGGKSFGMQRDNMGQAAAPKTPAGQNAPSAGAPAKAAGNRWMGPLAGLAAGGLLAALFMGGAFDGIKPFDIVLILGLAALLFFVIRALRRGAAPQSANAMRYAGNAGQSEPLHEVAQGGAMLGDTTEQTGAPRPAWFDEQNFLRTAKGHFIRLQAASDKNDLQDLREYTTPEVFAEISLQIRERNGAEAHTEVLNLHAELLDFISEADRHIASVRFYGTLREDKEGATESFDEIWHIQRSQTQANANWYIAGIQQTPVSLASRFHGGPAH